MYNLAHLWLHYGQNDHQKVFGINFVASGRQDQQHFAHFTYKSLQVLLGDVHARKHV